ncbi:MAG: RNA polymerase sigma factor [Phycisphaeraceae bacterium]|nr:MAG: RNA polymerase sigma factor [Phycisphaeraceae bacterium]
MTKHPDNPKADPDLIEACLAGDQSAWTELVERYSALVYSVPSRHRLPRDVCEDVFQGVWAIAVKHLSQLRDAQSLPAWLITTAQRETWRVAKRASRDAGVALPAEEIAWSDPQEADELEDRQRVRSAFARLGERCRRVLTETFRTERASYDLLAERLDMPRGSIGPTRARCLEKLRDLVGEGA